MSYSANYNALDRALHRFAFCSPIVQKVLAEVENDLFKKDYAAVESQDEVFITGLPRAGTTLMLELLFETGEFRSFTYREMPFILAPLLWSKLSRSFRKAATKQERAHGDGMEISVDSPEAFDEVIWLTYMGKQIVGDDRLAPVTAEDVDEEFIEAIRNCVRKLLASCAREATGFASAPLSFQEQCEHLQDRCSAEDFSDIEDPRHLSASARAYQLPGEAA